MNGINQRVQSLLKNKNVKVSQEKDAPDELELTSYILCKAFGWDYHTLVKQPIPFIMTMIKCIDYETKKQKEANDENSNNPKGSKKGMRSK